MPSNQSGVFPLYHPSHSLCGLENCHEPGWENCDSLWESNGITSQEARQDLASSCGIGCEGFWSGVNTVIQDDPQLTCRLEHASNPVRIVVDSRLRIPFTAQVLQNQKENQTVIATTQQASLTKRKALEQLGAKILVCDTKDGRVDMADLMRRLGEERYSLWWKAGRSSQGLVFQKVGASGGGLSGA